MDVMTLAHTYLGQFEQHGMEIKPLLCPFCQGGSHQDKYTFAMRADTGTYNCKRGSCNASGSFAELCKHFGTRPDRQDWQAYTKPKRQYKRPETTLKPLSNAAEQYLSTRKISRATMDAYGVSCDDNGNIVFPYYDGRNELVFVKFRVARKIQHGERKMWRESGTMPVLFGMHLCDPALPLYLTEGEFDTLALYEVGIGNVVSVPSGCEDFEWVDTCWEWLERFNRIVICGDMDDAGRKMVRTATQKLGAWRCASVELPRKDANEVLFFDGAEALAEAVSNAQYAPIRGLIAAADVVPLDVANMKRLSTGVKVLDRLVGGYYEGELSLWTGERGCGKSSFLGQQLLESIEQGAAVCAYSGELRPDIFTYWIHLQAAGFKHTEQIYNTMRECCESVVPLEVVNQIKAWYGNKLYLYDNSVIGDADEETGLLKVFEYAVRRYDCKVFLVDNLMTCQQEMAGEENRNIAETVFVSKLKRFAMTYGVHVHLVAHPRKINKQNGGISNDDVHGSGNITNLADNVFAISRIEEPDYEGATVKIKVLKCRFEGAAMGESLGLKFDVRCKRFEPVRGGIKRYGWETLEPPKWVAEAAVKGDDEPF